MIVNKTCGKYNYIAEYRTLLQGAWYTYCNTNYIKDDKLWSREN